MTQSGGGNTVVLGATNEHGFAMVKAFAAAGEHVHVLARTPEQAELLDMRLADPARITPAHLDFISEQALEDLARRIVASSGAIDHVVIALRYGAHGDTIWGDGEMGTVHTSMARIFTPLLRPHGSFQFHVCGDRPTPGLQARGPALVRSHDALSRGWGERRRVFLLAAGPDPAAVAALSVDLARDSTRRSERIVMPGAFVGDPTWDQLLVARAALDARLGGAGA